MRAAILLAICLTAVTLVAACATSPARADDYPYDEQVDVRFERLEVDDHLGRLEVDYRVDRDDWRWAERENFDLWIGVYAPHQGDYTFLHGMPIQSHRGYVRFPRKVRYFDYPYIELCVVAIGVGQRLDPGYGYLCESPVRVDINQRQRVSWRRSRVVFSLGFYSGMYRYPWFHPAYGFHYPYYYYRPPRVIVRHHPYHHHHHRRDRPRSPERSRRPRDDGRADRPRHDGRTDRPRTDRPTADRPGLDRRPDGRIERPGKQRTEPRRGADRSRRTPPKQQVHPRQRSAPTQRNVPRQQATPRQKTAPRQKVTPRQRTAPRQQIRPKIQQRQQRPRIQQRQQRPKMQRRHQMQRQQRPKMQRRQQPKRR